MLLPPPQSLCPTRYNRSAVETDAYLQLAPRLVADGKGHHGTEHVQRHQRYLRRVPLDVRHGQTARHEVGVTDRLHLRQTRLEVVGCGDGIRCAAYNVFGSCR